VVESQLLQTPSTREPGLCLFGNSNQHSRDRGCCSMICFIEYIHDRLLFCGIPALTHEMPCSYTPSRKNVKPSVKISPCQKINNFTTTLRGGDSLADTDTTLSGAEVLVTDNSLGLLDNLVTLDQDHLDVAGVGHVRVDLSIG